MSLPDKNVFNDTKIAKFPPRKIFSDFFNSVRVVKVIKVVKVVKYPKDFIPRPANKICLYFCR